MVLKMHTLSLLATVIILVLRQYANSYVAIPKNPPAPWKAALMARYIMHSCDWVSIATISTQDSIKGFPFVSLKSLSDGPNNNSTGIPYLYMTEMDVSGRDIQSDNRVTIMATLAQSSYCETQNFDPQDPRCAKILITGKLLKVSKSSPEYKFGLDSLFNRHPSMKNWPVDHEFYLAKVNMSQIDVLDFFGGIKHVNITDYFNATISYIINNDLNLTEVSVLDIRIIAGK